LAAYIGLLGCGTVGGGVVELLERRKDKIFRLTGETPELKRILVRDMNKPRNEAVRREWLTTSPEAILQDPDIAIVIETIGGIEPAREYILAALQTGKHVVTANKDLMALHGDEIHRTAASHNVAVLYEAAVGGAIPLVRPLKESLTANEISSIKGIVNGTCNFILSQMTETNREFNDVLQEAQQLGYAEADPSSDIDGLDSARKLVILAALAFHSSVRLEDVDVQGIRSVTAADVAYARELGFVIKLVAEGINHNGTLVLRVCPTLIPKAHPLANVSDANNALYVRGDAAGDLMFYGPGAGSLPTASAVVSDVIEVLRQMRLGFDPSSHPQYLTERRVDANLAPPRRHYIRLQVVDQPGVLARIAGTFADASVSMETVLQKRAENGLAELVIITHEVSPSTMRRVALAVDKLPSVREVCSVFPVDNGT
jgi:homoserine dehydrogenase